MAITSVTKAAKWASTIISACVQKGITQFAIAPGSRSTSLTLAVAQHPKAQHHIHFDERGLGFWALGYAKGSHQGVAIITTSGTAVANLLPSVIEAAQSQVPLLILTADRPKHLIEKGVNQAINQDHIFDPYVLQKCLLPCPSTDQTVLLASLKTVFDTRQGILKGPVHINCPFEEPVFSSEGLRAYVPDALAPLPLSPQPAIISGMTDLSTITDPLTDHSGIILLGTGISETEFQAIIALSEHLQWPIFPDISSAYRCHKHPHLISYFDILLHTTTTQAMQDISVILQFGHPLVSKSLENWIKKAPITHYIKCQSSSHPWDPYEKITNRIVADLTQTCRTITAKTTPRSTHSSLSHLQHLQHEIERALSTTLSEQKNLTEAHLSYLLPSLLPSEALFIGNSMPIRLLNLYAKPSETPPIISSNRGASGIDGLVSTAIGFFKAVKRPGTVLLGDLSFLHDLNGLAQLATIELPITFIVINNSGGGIFSSLAIAKESQVFNTFFKTAHTYSFDAIAKQFGLRYTSLSTVEQLYTQFENRQHHTLLEFQTESMPLYKNDLILGLNEIVSLEHKETVEL